MMTENGFKPDTDLRKRVLIGIIILFVGIGGLAGLSKLKKPPKEAEPEEVAIKVSVNAVFKKDIVVSLKGYGEVRALNSVTISPEIPGNVVEVNPKLEMGEIIPENESLFKIDSRDYAIDYQYSLERLKTLTRSYKLSKAEYERVKRLFVSENVESQSRVDMAEQTLNSVKDSVDRLKQGIEMAKLRLERCDVKAPFNARITNVRVEKGQYVAPGMNLLTISDDSILELFVALDSSDVRKWLRFKEGMDAPVKTAWFNDVKQTECDVKWTEAPLEYGFKGFLDRIANFDPKTRTITLAVRIKGIDARSKSPDKLSLVPGMFCRVEIPGKTLKDVYEVPRWAVTYENTIYVSKENRLKTRQVRIHYQNDESAFVTGEIDEGEKVIVTRLQEPLENSLLILEDGDSNHTGSGEGE